MEAAEVREAVEEARGDCFGPRKLQQGVRFQRRSRRKRVLLKGVGESGRFRERIGGRHRRIRVRIGLAHDRPLMSSAFGR